MRDETRGWLFVVTIALLLFSIGFNVHRLLTPTPQVQVPATVIVKVPVVTITPTPAPTVTVTARPTTASRSTVRTYPAWIVTFRECVAQHESATAGGYVAQNPASSASGRYQFVDATWRHYARQLGYSYPRAMLAPPAVQDHVFAVAAMDSPLHWRGTRCGYGT